MYDGKRDNRLLENKRRIDAERKERAIRREQQETLKRITPGVATPGSLAAQAERARRKRAEGDA